MKNKEDEGDENRNQNPNPAIKAPKGKSCKGCLYYSSIRNSKSQSPMCAGFSRTLQQVPSYIVGESELEDSKEGHSLTDFKYACVGYSVHLDKKDPSTDPQEKQAELPFCVGIELLLDKRPSHANHVPAHVHKREDGNPIPQPRTSRPSHSPWDEFVSRYARSASVVALGVARNAIRVGNHIKSNLDDVLYPYRRRPK
uniref:DUF8204 domain-containing protein n=1 Tax=Davidia involucrata TaxID=16924 RepID=A0A5B7BKJ3_DAVIN